MIRISGDRTRSRGRTAALTALVTLLGGLLGLIASAVPAAAHSGGRAVVLVRSLSVEPSGDMWHARATLTDNDSGAPIRGSKVTAFVGDPATAKAISMAAGGVPGVFEGMLPSAKPGPITLALKVRAVPGSEPVLPFDGQWNADLVAGQTAFLVAGSGEGGSSKMPMILGIVGGLMGVGLLYGLYSVRRRTAVPVTAK